MANLAAVCFMVPMAVGVAAASVSAQAIGAGQYHRARQVGMLSLGIVLAGATLTITLLVLLRPTLANAYTDDADVALRAVLLLQLLPFFHFFDAFQCLISYLLRAYKVAFVPMLLQFFALSVLGLGGGWWLGFGPAAGSLEGVIQWLAPGAPVGAASLWTMSSLGLGASALLLLFWYVHILRIYNPARRKTQASQ
jgi:MATE family multidrug resistance protein